MKVRSVVKLTGSLIAMLATTIFVTGFDPRWLLVRWSETGKISFPITGKLQIASRSYPLKRSSLSLLCGPMGPHLMLKSRLPQPDSSREGIKPSPEFAHRTALVSTRCLIKMAFTFTCLKPALPLRTMALSTRLSLLRSQ
jgi:hypothetical protein